MVTSPQALTETLRRIPLLTSAQNAELVSDSARYNDAKGLARQMLQRGWLTSFQVNQLFMGKGADLVIGPYVLLERLGEGGAGQVFKARHQHMNRIVALKLIRKELLTDREVVGRFHREIQMVSSLTHPNVVQAFDGGPMGRNYFLVMELVQGIDLGRLIQEKGPIPTATGLAYLRQAALGLQHVHQRGLVHRDIKPSNLLVVKTEEGLGQIKILDLGLARLQRPIDGQVTGAVTGDVTTMGTLDYMAPEQALDFHRVDIRADIYSLGCTFYHALSGQPPFAGGTLAQKLMRHQQVEAPLLRTVPSDVALVIRRMMAKRPADRFQTPLEVLEALPAPTATLVLTGPPPSKWTIAKRWLAWGWRLLRTRGGMIVAGCLALLLVLAILLPGSSGGIGSGRGKSVFLSDLPEIKPRVYWMAKFGKDGNLGFQDRRITLNGVVSTKGLGVHPGGRDTSSVSYRLEGKYQTFQTTAALNDSVTRSGSPMIFVVIGDSKTLWQSNPIQKRGDQQECQVKITGVDLLELIVTCSGDNADGHAVWIDPQVR